MTLKKKQVKINSLRILLFLSLNITGLNSIFGQNVIVHGKITNQQNQPLNSASIIVKDSLMHIKNYTYSDSSGNYILHIHKLDKYDFIYSSLGYQRKTISKKIKKGEKKIEINIVLKKGSFDLDEIHIKSDQPITVKKDTIIFKTKFFKNGTEETVEDLLKKIPGLAIDDEGNIKVGNTEIEKLMIDGDDFFGKGYKILSKNMPAYPIEEVEVLKHYSSNRLLKGIEESNKVALNLKLDEKSKRVWFGNIEGSLGNAHFYETKLNLMNFGKENKYYFLGNLNNIGADITGNVNSLIYSSSSAGSGGLDNYQKAQNLLSLSATNPDLDRSRTNFNNDKIISLNAIFNPTDNLKIKPIVFLNWTNKYFYRNTIDVTNVGETTFTNTENYELHHKNRIAFGKLELTYDISNTQMLTAITTYNKRDKNGRAQLLFNGSSTLESLKNRNELFDQKINYTHKFKKKKVLVLSGRFIDEKKPQNYHINQFYYESLFPDLANANNVKQRSSDHMQYAGINAHLLDRKKDMDLLELQIGDEYRKDELNTGFSLFDDETLIDNPEGYQNHTWYETNDLYVKIKYRLAFNNLEITGKIGLHQLFNNLKNNSIVTNQTPFFVNPSLGLSWEINTKNKITLSYAYNKTNTEILDVYDKYVLTGFRSFSKGTGQFDQLSASNFIFGYTLGNWVDRFFANFFIIYNKNHDFFSTNSHLHQNYTQTQKILVKNREFINLNANLNYYFNAISSNLKLILGYSVSNYKNSVNDSDLRKVTSYNYRYGIELRSSFNGIFNYRIGTKWAINQVKTSFKNSYTDNKSFLNLYFKFSDRFNADVKSNFYHFGSLQKDKNYYFLDLEARYKLLPEKLTLGLSGKNLFNTKEFRQYSISDIGFSTTAYRLLPRMVLLKVKFRF